MKRQKEIECDKEERKKKKTCVLLHNSGVNVKIDGDSLLLNSLKQRKKYHFCQKAVTWDTIQWSIIAFV